MSGSMRTFCDRQTDGLTSKIVDMPLMKLNYTIHFHTVSEYDKYKI